MKVELIARTIEKVKYPDEFGPKNVNNDIKILAGKAAGICYAPDNYLSEGIQDSEKAIKRASFNAKSGHYSVYEHSHLTFLIECTKAMAMVLNSTRLYSTSEKSARYTKMHAETEFERDYYGEWFGIFSELIKTYNKNLSDKDVEKLAMENARYLTSVFTPTFLEFTIPSDRAILIPEWLDNLSFSITKARTTCLLSGEDTKIFNIYYNRLSKECKELAFEIRNAIGEPGIPTLKDHKNIGIQFFDTIKYINFAQDNNSNININHNSISKIDNENYDKNILPININHIDDSEYYGDIYKSKYYASFASVAQIQRHRTTQVSISTPDYNKFYIPKIIRHTPYEEKWKECYANLIKNGVCPQAMLLYVEEKGSFEDFILKCKERLCARTQLETMEIVRDQCSKFNINKDNLSLFNRKTISNIVGPDKYQILTRCAVKGYKCNEPCNRTKSNYTRNI